MQRRQDERHNGRLNRSAAPAPEQRMLPDVISVLLATGQFDLAFEKIYERLFGKVFDCIVKQSTADKEAEDLTRKVFLKIRRDLPHYDAQRASLATWVFVIIKNTLKQYDPDHKESMAGAEAHATANTELAEAYQLQGLRDRLAELLWQLPDIDRYIVVLRYFRNLSSQATADLLGLTSGNVRVRLSRALDKLARFASEPEKEVMRYEIC